MNDYQVPKIDKYGNIFWRNEKGCLHREDGPACEYHNGNKYWYINGTCHREDGPAIEYTDGTKFWYHYGKLHCENGPALEYADGRIEYWINGVLYNSLEEYRMDQALD